MERLDKEPATASTTSGLSVDPFSLAATDLQLLAAQPGSVQPPPQHLLALPDAGRERHGCHSWTPEVGFPKRRSAEKHATIRLLTFE
ncbi:hypothetical protein V2A60_001224 [Cordyceps javanica]